VKPIRLDGNWVIRVPVSGSNTGGDRFR
jgi:hypothetical protein